MKRILLALAFALAIAPHTAQADVSLLVLEAVGVAGEFTSSGHTAIYLSNICADDAVNLRLCRAGEKGVVISSYPSFGKDATQEWLAIPVTSFLYGVENEREIPLYANGKVRNFLREAYREKHLKNIVPRSADGTMPEGGWRTMLTMAFNRDVYSFNIKTTLEEDAEFLNEFNKLPNKNEFSSFANNCADFSRKIINKYFPGAARRDVINDFGITTPKALAKSLTGYATKRPERLFNITKYPQVPGTIWRSYDIRNFSEKAFMSKKYLIPSLIFEPPLIAVFAGSYFATGRYSVHRTYKKYATPEIARLNLDQSQIRKAKREEHPASIQTLAQIAAKKEAERLKTFGNKRTSREYKANFARLLKSAIAEGYFQDEKEVKTFFKDLEHNSEPAFDANGSLVLRVRYAGNQRILGITRDNISGANSDVELAYKLMLAKIYANLKAREKDRTPLAELKSDWELMRQLSTRVPKTSPAYAQTEGNARRFSKATPPTTFKSKLRKLFINITS